MPGDSEGTETTAALSKDDIVNILQNSRHRSAVRFLAEWDGKR